MAEDCPIWPARTRQNPRNPEFTKAQTKRLDYLHKRTCKQMGVTW